jgi:hypothetical protein
MTENQPIGENKYRVFDNGEVWTTLPHGESLRVLFPNGTTPNRSFDASIIVEALRLQTEWREQKRKAEAERAPDTYLAEGWLWVLIDGRWCAKKYDENLICDPNEELFDVMTSVMIGRKQVSSRGKAEEKSDDGNIRLNSTPITEPNYTYEQARVGMLRGEIWIHRNIDSGQEYKTRIVDGHQEFTSSSYDYWHSDEPVHADQYTWRPHVEPQPIEPELPMGWELRLTKYGPNVFLRGQRSHLLENENQAHMIEDALAGGDAAQALRYLLWIFRRERAKS